MAKTLDLPVLQNALKKAAAFRCRTRLQPAGGQGDKVFPPTYAGAVYAMEERRVPEFKEPVRCVLMDSVQSQANRFEEALQDAVDDGRIKIPVVEVDFSDIEIVEPGSKEPGLYEPIGRITSLEAPHRVADAILRDSELEGKSFRSSEEGIKISKATLRNATPLFELCPTALVFGIWDSTGPKGGLGVKFQRAVVSEIIGVNASVGVQTSSRIDPIVAKNPPLYEKPDGSWTVEPGEAVQEKGKPKAYPKKLSAMNFGNVTPDYTRYDSKNITAENRQTPDVLRKDGGFIEGNRIRPGGVTISHAEQTVVLSLAAFRRLRFPLNGKLDTEVNRKAQVALAALGLCGAVLANERGLDLRSRCLLWPTEPPVWELLGEPGKEPETFQVDAEQAIKLLNDAIDDAVKAGLPWRIEPLRLKPAKKLVDLVRKSQELAVASAADEGGQ